MWNTAQRVLSVWHLGIEILIFLGLIVCTVVDILPQSLSSGQFWNAIIVIVSVCLIGIFSLAIFLVRLVQARRWLRSTPRKYMIGQRDIPAKAARHIETSRERCVAQYHGQFDRTSIQHDGLQNPDTKASVKFETPFVDILEVIPLYLEEEVLAIDPTLVHNKSLDLGEYLQIVFSCGVLNEKNRPLVARFLNLYEACRFGGAQISEKMLIELLSSFSDLVVLLNRTSVDDTEGISLGRTDTKSTTSGSSTRSTASGSVVIHYNDSPNNWLSTLTTQESVASAVHRNSETVQSGLAPTRSSDSRESTSTTATVIRH